MHLPSVLISFIFPLSRPWLRFKGIARFAATQLCVGPHKMFSSLTVWSVPINLSREGGNPSGSFKKKKLHQLACISCTYSQTQCIGSQNKSVIEAVQPHDNKPIVLAVKTVHSIRSSFHLPNRLNCIMATQVCEH